MSARAAAFGLCWLVTMLGVPNTADAQSRQAPEVVEVAGASLAPPGLDLVEAGWRYSAGDDPRWAAADFDDSGWMRIASTWREPSSPSWPWTGIGWFRLRVRLAADVTEPVGLELRMWGASEVYVDGIRVAGFGTVSGDPRKERTRDPRGRSATLAFVGGRVHTVALRVSSWPLADGSRSGRWFAEAEFPAGFRSRLVRVNVQTDSRDRTHSLNVALSAALTALFASFGLLHLVYFGLRRSERGHLWFAGYALSLSLLVGTELRRELVDHSVWGGALLYLRGYLLLSLMAFSLVSFVFAATRRPLPWIAVALLVADVLVAAAVIVRPMPVFADLHGALQVAMLAVAIAGAARAMREGLPAGWLVTIGAAAGGLPLVLTSLESFGIEVESRSIFILVGLATVLAVASAAQARRFAWTSEQLREQLERVQELSARERERDLAQAQVRAERDRERAEAERQAHELEEARVFQLSLLPSRLPELVGWEAVASMQTASEVGGDYFDVRRMPDGVATLVIGDATGHGLRAGTLVATTKGLFQAVGDSGDLGVALQVMGAALRDLRLRGLFMALTIVRLHPDGRAEVATAGMPPALLLDADGEVSAIGAPAPPLGAPVRFAYETRTLHVRSGARLVLMTDGVPERLDAGDELFGYAKVPALAAMHRDRHGAEYIRALEADLDAFAGRPPTDDATLLVIARH